MYSKILVPLDGSDLSREALKHAERLAVSTKSPITLLQVVDSEEQLISQASGITIEPMAMGEITVDAARSAVAAQRETAKQNLEAARAKLAEAGVEAAIEIREGHPGDEIVEAAEELGADVVVMATHGRTGFRRAILGSVADHVARHTPNASVMLIKPDKKD